MGFWIPGAKNLIMNSLSWGVSGLGLLEGKLVAPGQHLPAWNTRVNSCRPPFPWEDVAKR